MAKKFPGGRITFNAMLTQIREQKEDPLAETSSDPNLHYKHLIVYHELGTRRNTDILFQRLSTLRKSEGTGAVVQDNRYIPGRERASAAFILRGRDLKEMEESVQKAMANLPLEYELRDY